MNSKILTQDNDLNPSDLEAAQAFIKEYSTLKKLSKGSKVKYRCALWALLAEVNRQGKRLDTLDKPAILDLINFLSSSKWEEDTREDYWKRWLLFCEWYSDRDGHLWSEETKKLLLDPKKKYRYKIDRNKVERKGTFTPEEILELVSLESRPEYQVFWAVLYESGMRSGEAIALRIGDVKELPGKGYMLELPRSKTEKRSIPIVHFSKNYLSRWLRTHPRANDANAPLFVNAHGDPMDNKTANKHLGFLLKVARMKRKKISLHSFRHSRATELCHVLNESQLCKFFGWSIGSSMPRTYIRREQIDVTNALLRGYGLEEQQHHEIKGRVCLSCTHLNPFTAEWCDICKLPLDAQKLQQLKEAGTAQAMFNNMKEQLIEEVASKIKSHS